LLRLCALLLHCLLLVQCSGRDQGFEPKCVCVCSDGRFPACAHPQRQDCPPSSCEQDDSCDAYCRSEAACAEDEPRSAQCDVELDAYGFEVLCRDVEQCEGVEPEECLERFEPFICEFDWLLYLLCVGENGCDAPRCRMWLGDWEECAAAE
jgi:hypothetical protein